MTLAKAAAPLAAALRGYTGSYTPVLIAVATLCATAAAGLALAGTAAPREMSLAAAPESAP
jgi:hypothetical protein